MSDNSLAAQIEVLACLPRSHARNQLHDLVTDNLDAIIAALRADQRCAELEAENARLRRHIEWITPGLHVLRGILRTAGLKIGAERADEMIRETAALGENTDD